MLFKKLHGMDEHHQEPIKVIERIGQVAVLQLPVPDFSRLSLNEKMVAYHLAHAAIIGDSITYQQNYRYGLQLRDFFLDLLDFKDEFSKKEAVQLESYAKQLLLHHGNHDAWSTTKFLPEFKRDFLEKAAKKAKKKGFSHILDDNLTKAIFDPDFERMLTQKSPGKGEDIITASHTTFYDGVTLKDLEGFEDRNPNNSTVAMEDGKIVERIWRAGSQDTGVPPGVYADQLVRVCHHLQQAARYADEGQKKSLIMLKQYFQEGTAHLWDDYNISWVHTNPAVDTIFGFVEEYRDTRGMKGLFEGMVFFPDTETTKMITQVAAMAQTLEDESPWPKEYKKQWTKTPVANAITLIIGTGGSGPFCWAGVNLPNSQALREEHGSKNVVVSNVTRASRTAFAEKSLKEFLEHEEDIKRAMKDIQLRGNLMVTLHEIVGHGSGKVNPKLKGDPRDHLREYYSTLEEARAELCALHHIHNPLLYKAGIVPDEEMWKASYFGYATMGITQLRSLEKENELHEDHFRAGQLIVEYLRNKTGCIEFYKKNGKTYARVTDYEKMKEGVAELLSGIMEIKAEGDYAAGKALVEKYAVKFDHALRDEAVARAKAIEYPSFYSYVMPIPKMITNVVGDVADVVLEHPSDLLEQGKKWRELESS